MKIIKLEAENFKRIKAVAITPTGSIVELTGKNAQGKSSVLDAIWAALGGASHIQAEPIRKGAAKAKIRLDLGEIVVSRNFTKSGTTLTVENAEGASYKSPQKMLDDLIGALAFDPLAFCRMKPKEQFDVLKGLAKVDLDLDTLEAQNKKDYEARTAANRLAAESQALASAITIPDDPGPIQDAASILAAIEELQESRGTIEHEIDNRARLERTIQEKKDLFARKRQELVEIKAEIEALDSTLESLQEPASTTLIDDQIAELRQKAGNISALMTAKAARDAALAKKAEAEGRAAMQEGISQKLTEAMEARTKAKQDAISAAKMPIPELGFGDGVVLYQGVPFDQASSAEQLKVSTGIAMASNPKLRVIRITDGSLLDEDSMAMLRQMAEENDFQVWLEIVDSSKKVGIVIEDGSVIADNQAAPEVISPEQAGALADSIGKVLDQDLGAATLKAPLEDLSTLGKPKGQPSAYDALTTNHPAKNLDEKLSRNHAQGLDLDIP